MLLGSFLWLIINNSLVPIVVPNFPSLSSFLSSHSLPFFLIPFVLFFLSFHSIVNKVHEWNEERRERKETNT